MKSVMEVARKAPKSLVVNHHKKQKISSRSQLYERIKPRRTRYEWTQLTKLVNNNKARDNRQLNMGKFDNRIKNRRIIKTAKTGH